VDEIVALESQTIKHMIEDDCADSGIPLPNVTSKILAKVIEYCKKHVEATSADEKPTEDELKAWDADFVKVDQATLFDLILVCSLELIFSFIYDFIMVLLGVEVRVLSIDLLWIGILLNCLLQIWVYPFFFVLLFLYLDNGDDDDVVQP